MDKLLTAIASGLSIRPDVNSKSEKALQKISNTTVYECDYKDITNRARKRFKKEFADHLFNKLKKIEVGECVEYYFNYANIRSIETIIEKANDNMAEVLLRLPALKEGENYEFPYDTYISFKLIERYEAGGTVEINSVCLWIKEAYTKQ